MLCPFGCQILIGAAIAREFLWMPASRSAPPLRWIGIELKDALQQNEEKQGCICKTRNTRAARALVQYRA
jgi:hypothetical protein